MSVGHLAYVAAVALILACLAVVVALVVVRYRRDRAEVRHLRHRAPLWPHVLALSTGEPDEVEAASRRLLASTPHERAVLEDDAFALVPKLRGSARDRLRDVLRAWGSVRDALADAGRRSPVSRCRGLYRLGILAEPEGLPHLLRGLDDHDFGVRRMAVLALGSFPQEEVVDQLLRCAAREPRLRRDFLASVDRIGRVAVPVLRAALARSIDAGIEEERAGFLAAEALGLVGAVEAVPALEAGLLGSSVELRIACIDALGDLGAPTSVVALCGPLGDVSPDVRRAAAHALGMIGGDWGVPALTPVLNDPNVEVARAAANALRRCGSVGRSVLETSSAPVAREVVALSALGGPG